MFVFNHIKPTRATDAAHESFPYFDWLRFVLASVVALYHEQLLPWGQAGNFAVQVFFALSGWLIGGILLRSKRSDLPRFYFNRASRIWIPYVIAVAVLYLLAVFHEPVTNAFFKFLTFDLTFTHNYFIEVVPSVAETMPLKGTGNHFWSISVEEQFYLAAPILLVLLPFGRSIALWALLAALAIMTRFWYGSIALGVLAAVIRCRYGDWQFTRRGVAVVIATVLALTATMATFRWSYDWAAPPLAASIVLGLSWSGRRSSIGEFFGGISYPLYLYHWVGGFAARFLSHWLWLPSLTPYVFSILCGTAAYLTVDRNVMRWRGHLYRPAFGRALMIIAYCIFAAGLMAGAALG